MSYSSKTGRRPSEYASKINHTFIINDQVVKRFLEDCDYPKEMEQVDVPLERLFKLDESVANPIENVIAIDGGRQEVPIKQTFPSSTLTFFQFGALYFSVDDLENLYVKEFIEPSDIAKLKEIQRYKFVLPTKNIKSKSTSSLTDSVRKALHDFFVTPQAGGHKFIDSLKWLLFEEYQEREASWKLNWCPVCKDQRDILFNNQNILEDYTFRCPNNECNAVLYLTDVFRLHEVIDDDLGASGIVGYLGGVLEQLVLVHLIKYILETKPDLLNHFIFIKDGQLAFYGQTANLHSAMLKLVNYLFDKHNLYLVGLEKSGAFVEHADAIANKIPPGHALLLNSEYIYRYITPGKANENEPYGGSTYYGNKVIFRSDDKKVYVVTVAGKKVITNPQVTDYPNLNLLLLNIKKLKCDMYDSSLIPISLVNKLVSLANRPSSILLEKFARKSINGH